MIDWRGQGHSSRRLRDPRKGYVRDFSDFEIDVETFVQQVVLPDCRRHSSRWRIRWAGAVMLRVAHGGKRWFDRMVLSAPMIDLPAAAPRFRRARCCACCGSPARADATFPAAARLDRHRLLHQHPLTSDPVRYARNAAILEEDPTLGIGSPTVAWADTAFKAMRGFRASDYPSQIRQPILMLAASNDTVGLDVGDRGVRLSSARRFASRDRRCQHEILQEQDRYRAQFWAAFDAFVPGTPLFK